MKASESPYKEIQWLQTGFPNLDRILGGGIPSRKITEISGVWGIGKSTLSLQIIAEAQKLKMETLWCDSEFSFDDEYATDLGVDCDRLDLIQGRYAEENLDAIEEWADKHTNALMVLDSIGGLLPRAEMEKNADGKVIGGQAKIIATFCRKIVPILAINNSALIVCNHQFTDLMSGKLKTSGGEKLAYAKSIWLMLRSSNKRLMKGENQVGVVVEAEIRKNKVANTMKQKTELNMVFGNGFDHQADLLAQALEKGIIRKEGRSYFLGEEKLSSGMPGLRKLMQEPSFADKLSKQLSTGSKLAP